MFKDDDEGKLEGEDFPVDRGEVAFVISEPTVEARLLQYSHFTCQRSVLKQSSLYFQYKSV